MKLKKNELTLTRSLAGGWVVSAIVAGYRTERLYYGYTKTEAINQYLYQFNKKGN
jgi:hypothetical protein